VNSTTCAPAAVSRPIAFVVPLAEGVEVDPRPQDVVAAGVDGDQVGLERDRRLELLGEDRGQLAAADREVGVAEVVGRLLASTSATRSAQPRRPLGRVGSGSPTPSVNESPRAT
jgi:hypothetical protein